MRTGTGALDQAGPRLAAGERVIARHRMPTPAEPWLGTWWVGTVVDAADMSEVVVQGAWADEAVVVDWPFGVVAEPASTLMRVDDADEALSHRDKVARFLGPGALARYDREAGRRGLGVLP